MEIKIIFIGLLLVNRIYQFMKLYMEWKSAVRPLPEAVADIYDKETYDQYLRHKKEGIPVTVLSSVIGISIDAAMIFSPFLPWVEQIAGQNAYLIYFVTYFLVFAASRILECPVRYYETFKIEEKYGLNKKDKKGFFKEFAIGGVSEVIMTAVLGVLVILLCENIGKWTNRFAINYYEAAAVAAVIFLAAALMLLFTDWMQMKTLRAQYTFTELEDGQLRDKIEKLMADCPKKVKSIKVYNESQKSNSKNAFVYTMLGYREFGIADNFILEHSERELLAVLAHEIGHLKHRKNLLNYVSWVFLGVVFAMLVYLIPNAGIVAEFTGRVNQEFGIRYTNYYLMISIFVSAYTYIDILTSMFGNYRKRREETEADYNAAVNGYGEELIRTFKMISQEEFVDVNPSPFVEFMDYDHPGMYKRILMVKKMMNK